MKSNFEIIEDLASRYDGNITLTAMKQAQLEAIKELMKRWYSNTELFGTGKSKSLSDISLELIKEIENG